MSTSARLSSAAGKAAKSANAWADYPLADAHDELIGPGGKARPGAGTLRQYLARLDPQALKDRRLAAEQVIRSMGITFTVYQPRRDPLERLWPLDIVPRVITKREWQRVEAGLKQRVHALNLFIDDVYHAQRILRDGVVPRALVMESKNFRPECVGVTPRHGVWAHVCGSDLVRDKDGSLYVLEDNLRVPSGVSYMLENRLVMKRVFPELFRTQRISPADDYVPHLLDTLASISPRRSARAEIAVLTPGPYNSAYFEHAYLAQQMGAELVLGSDLIVGADDCVYMRTIAGPVRVDVIYRRVDDLFLDPSVFRADSLLGVPGIVRAWRRGNVAIANAPGTGVADDKAIYAFVPRMIKYYLDQDAILPNVETYACFEPSQRAHVLANIERLVIKPTNESGGYGIVIGPQASTRERAQIAAAIRRDPRNYVAQPLITLSTCPTVVGERLEPRHLDLRPFVLSGARPYVSNGGLTRVALRKGSFVVNSSQGGGSKDTWIVE